MWSAVKKINKQVLKEYFKFNHNTSIRNVTTSLTIQPEKWEEVKNEELKQSQIIEAVQAQPLLASASQDMWERSHDTFKNHGLTTKAFLEIAIKNPAILKRSEKKNSESIENWRSCQFGEKFLHTLLVNYPELLNVPSERQILKRTTFLKGFVSTNKYVWKLIMNCPNVLEEREKVIVEKFNYLTNTMRIEMHEIVKSKALAKSLEEIRCRHVLLDRLNMFKLRSLRLGTKQPVNNPHLSQIVDTTDEHFAKKVARVSMLEFECFKELFAREMKRKESENDDDDFEDED